MFTSLTKTFGSSTLPSAILAFRKSGFWVDYLHLLPEDGSMEWFKNNDRSSTFHHHGATEKIREQLATITLRDINGEGLDEFIKDIKARVGELWDDSMKLSETELQKGEFEMITPLVENVLRPAVLDTMREREGRESSGGGTATYSISLIYIQRSRPRLISYSPRCFE